MPPTAYDRKYSRTLIVNQKELSEIYTPFATPARNLKNIAIGKLRARPNIREKIPLPAIVSNNTSFLPLMSDNQPQKKL